MDISRASRRQCACPTNPIPQFSEEFSRQNILIVEVWGQAKRRGAPEYQNLVLIRRSEIGKLEDEIELIFCALGLLMRPGDDKSHETTRQLSAQRCTKRLRMDEKLTLTRRRLPSWRDIMQWQDCYADSSGLKR